MWPGAGDSTARGERRARRTPSAGGEGQRVRRAAAGAAAAEAAGTAADRDKVSLVVGAGEGRACKWGERGSKRGERRAAQSESRSRRFRDRRVGGKLGTRPWERQRRTPPAGGAVAAAVRSSSRLGQLKALETTHQEPRTKDHGQGGGGGGTRLWAGRGACACELSRAARHGPTKTRWQALLGRFELPDARCQLAWAVGGRRRSCVTLRQRLTAER